jgi:hypothetical protein
LQHLQLNHLRTSNLLRFPFSQLARLVQNLYQNLMNEKDE